MTDYGFANSSRITLPSDTVQKKKEARKKLLEAVFQKRRENSLRRYKKMQLHTTDELDTIAWHMTKDELQQLRELIKAETEPINASTLG